MINSVILSGLPVSGKTTLARRLSQVYGWPIYSIGQLWREEWRQRYPGGSVSFEEFWRNITVEENLKKNVEAREIFERGHVIGDTRYSLYCQDVPALLIFLTADLQTRAYRAARVNKYIDKSLREIEQILEEREQDEVRVGEQLYGEYYDYRDPRHYHIALNTGRLTVEEEVAAIEKLVSLRNTRK